MKPNARPWIMRTCPICGKEFLPAGMHSWTIGNNSMTQELVCSYTCMRKWEKNSKKKNNYGIGKKVKVRIIETGEVFDSIKQCADKLRTSTSSIHNCIYKGKTSRGFHIEKVDEDN